MSQRLKGKVTLLSKDKSNGRITPDDLTVVEKSEDGSLYFTQGDVESGNVSVGSLVSFVVIEGGIGEQAGHVKVE